MIPRIYTTRLESCVQTLANAIANNDVYRFVLENGVYVGAMGQAYFQEDFDDYAYSPFWGEILFYGVQIHMV